MASSSKDDRAPSLWQMNKTQLFAEATRLGIVTHPTWTTGEVRQLIADKRAGMNQVTTPKGMASMTRDQLLAECDKLGVEYPSKPTKGQLMLIIRDSTTYGRANCVVTFGRHKGKLFSEVPHSYLAWSQKEVAAQGRDACTPELVSLSMYATEVFRKDLPFDPEASPSVPIPDDNASASSCWESHWSELTDVAKELNGYRAPWDIQRPVAPKAAPEQPTAAPKIAPKSGYYKRTQENENKEPMEQDVPPEVKKEVEDLMARLAAIKDRYNM